MKKLVYSIIGAFLLALIVSPPAFSQQASKSEVTIHHSMEPQVQVSGSTSERVIVEVTVPEPKVDVTMPQPDVRVTYPEPKVDVKMAPRAQSRGETSAPQAQMSEKQMGEKAATSQTQVSGEAAGSHRVIIEVTVPEAKVDVIMPQPQVQVSRPEPRVDVRTEPITQAGAPTAPQAKVSEPTSQAAAPRAETIVLAPAMSWDTVRASDLLGVDLMNEEKIYVGRIDDLGIDPSSGLVSHIIISGVRDRGSAEYAIPSEYVYRESAQSYIFTPPEEMISFRGPDPYHDVEYDFDKLRAMPEGHLRFSELLGDSIQARGGEHLGSINDAVINLPDRRVVYVVLSDVAGREDKLAAVPFQSFSWTGDMYAIDLERERLSTAPDFTWDKSGDQTYVVEVYRYYGVQPYWEIR